MLPATRKVVSSEEFNELFQKEALIAEFASPEEEVAYERRDSFLIHLIKREAERCFGTDKERQPFVGDDWWPDHTRLIEATPAHCTATFLTALRALLQDDYTDYRIQICVYRDSTDGNAYIGSMNLHSDRVLIQRTLYELLQSSGTVAP